ncbi:hypothetical protein CALCODRAFT_485461 [Calocera cornea HHB12733]|uniref:Uncharacterized protein n=1 Tax=Calocera cornea HHB12733 TaxID=1353952 RepID=A0A165EBG4_9BASI|nr:hypothetical protein CALCODRAFT_485461 [Calocera cornea HHB12733]
MQVCRAAMLGPFKGTIKGGESSSTETRVRTYQQILLQSQCRVQIPLYLSQNVFGNSADESLFSTTSFLLSEQHVGVNQWYCASCKKICTLSEFPGHPCKEITLTTVTIYMILPNQKEEGGPGFLKVANSLSVLITLKYGAQKGCTGFSTMWLLMSRHVITLALAQLSGDLQGRTIPLQRFLSEDMLSPDVPQVDYVLAKGLAARNGT